MDLVWVILGIFLILVGVVGCFLPVIPGPTLAFFGLLVTQFKESPPFTVGFLVFWGVTIAGTAVLDYLITPLATKKFGGSQKGVIGSVVGLLIGVFFFPPIGFIVGPLLGAYAGELIDGKDAMESMKAALGALIGFISGALLKITVVFVMAYYFFKHNF